MKERRSVERALGIEGAFIEMNKAQSCPLLAMQPPHS